MLSWMEGYLADHDNPDPRVSSRWLVSDAVGLTFMELYTNLERPLDSGELDLLRANVRRRAEGEPLQYIVGKTGFRHIDVIVREGVLIPGPKQRCLSARCCPGSPGTSTSRATGKWTTPTSLWQTYAPGADASPARLLIEPAHKRGRSRRGYALRAAGARQRRGADRLPRAGGRVRPGRRNGPSLGAFRCRGVEPLC